MTGYKKLCSHSIHYILIYMKCTCENQNICPTYPRNLFYRMVERVLIHPLLILCFQIKGYMETAYVFYREQTLPHIAFKTYLLLVVKVIILSQDKFEDIKGIIRSRKRTDNAMAKSKRTNRQAMIYNTRCRKLIKVITKLPNSEQSYKGKVQTHNYINRQNQSTTGKLWKP